MRRVLYDINVVLDVLLDRRPHVTASARALDAASTPDVEGWLAAHATTTLFYLLARQVGAQRARSGLGRLLEQLRVAPVDDEIVRRALTSPITDFEDAVTAGAAEAVGAGWVITRNGKDFAGGPVPAVHPAAWIL